MYLISGGLPVKLIGNNTLLTSNIYSDKSRKKVNNFRSNYKGKKASETMEQLKISFLSAVLGGIVLLFLHLYNVFVTKPKAIRSRLEKQGIRGPSPSFLLGNISEIKRIQHEEASRAAQQEVGMISHNWSPTAFAYLEKYKNDYGPIFMYSAGSIQVICITQMDLVKEINQCTSLSLGKPSYLSKDRGPLLGQGILASSGPLWAHQRKVIAPELYLEKVKGMVNLMGDSTLSLVKDWESRIETEGEGVAEISVDTDMKSLAADVISRACFGSSYSKGQEIFSKFGSLLEVMSKEPVGVPALRYLPTKNNREIWRLEKEINSMILQVVKERCESSCEKDLLQMILEGAKSCGDYNGVPLNVSCDKFIVDNCKNIYFAGHETSAITASWSFLLLALYPEWQDRVRTEVLRICKGNRPNSEMLRSMKTVTMVIQETLRLYPPAGFVFREALDDINFKDIVIPKGMGIQVPIPILQHNPDLWGPDAHDFNPERFANGIIGACKIPQAYMPFGAGPRACAGQHFAMAELKVILSLILSKFSFSLSPKYRHSPVVRVNIVPQHGITLHVKRI
ncbi:hypothetical protein JRO89_XS01G0005700 [Xanthoceras sorbifolium]|uniref:Cytochrome P450 n=1 Tax=Xanthoceras sorbifolium TaxID=99658 RepID=A0ABQ8IHL5_9ROSI|nr:hypothetical protein JRO89_XS01G0005700 [Xanthoceras sorbifolium]